MSISRSSPTDPIEQSDPVAGAARFALTFFGAGFVGLVFELVWVRELSLVFGASNYAISTVLSSYMAGLALGGFWLGRRSAGMDPAQARRTYARLLVGVGASGLVVTLVGPLISLILAPVLGSFGWNTGVAIFLRWLFSFCILLVPATMLGGLYPLVARLAIADVRVTGSRLGLLYFLNTFGSVLGALATGFLLLERLGVTETAVLAAVLSAGLWLVMQRSQRKEGFKGSRNQGIKGPALESSNPRILESSPSPSPYPRAVLVTLAVAYGLSGFAGLGYEVVWARALATVLGHPLYSVTIVTAAFLSGLALGGLVFGRLCDRWKDPAFGFGVLESTIAGTALLTLLLVSTSAYGILGWLGSHASGTFAGTMLGLAGFCFLVLFAPAFLMGATFPVLARVFVSDREGHDRSTGARNEGSVPGVRTLVPRPSPLFSVPARVARAVGWLYGANSVGAVLGSLVAGFVLLPLLGATRANVVLAGLSLAVAVTAALSSRARKPVKGLAVTVFAGAYVALALVTGAHPFHFLPPNVAASPDVWKVVYYRETTEGVVTTAQNPAGDCQTWVNSTVVCGSALPALKPVRIMGVLPFVLHPNPKDILVIGYGLGVTASLLVDLSRGPVDCIEITPGVFAASQAFARWNGSVFANPRLRLAPGDGRNFLLCTNRTFDVISCDPTHPSLGSGALYTRDFYRLVKHRLRPGGIFTLYLPFHQIPEPEFRRLLNTFAAEFPHCALWLGIAHGVLVGSRDAPLRLDYQRALAVFDSMPLQSRLALRNVFIDDARKLCGSMALDSAGVKRVGDHAGIATDDRPSFEYAGARAGGAANWAGNAELVADAFTGPGTILEGAGTARDSVISAAAATASRFRATIAAMQGNRNEQLGWFRRALEIDPSDREASRFLAMSLPQR